MSKYQQTDGTVSRIYKLLDFSKRGLDMRLSLTMSAAGKGVSEEGDERALEDWTQETVGVVRQVTLLGVKWVTSWVQPF